MKNLFLMALLSVPASAQTYSIIDGPSSHVLIPADSVVELLAGGTIDGGVSNSGILISSGTITNNKLDDYVYGISARDSQTFILNGNISSFGQDWSHTIDINNSFLLIQNGNFTASGDRWSQNLAVNQSTTIINGGNFTATATVRWAQNLEVMGGLLIIRDGNFYADENIMCWDDGRVVIYGGNFRHVGYTGIQAWVDSYVDIRGGNFQDGQRYTISLSLNSHVTICGSEFQKYTIVGSRPTWIDLPKGVYPQFSGEVRGKLEDGSLFHFVIKNSYLEDSDITFAPEPSSMIFLLMILAVRKRRK